MPACMNDWLLSSPPQPHHTHSLTHSLRSSITHSLRHSLAHHDPHSLTCSLIMRGVADSGGALVHAGGHRGRDLCFLSDQSGLASRTVTLLSHHHPMKCSLHTRNARDKIVDMRPHCKLCNERASNSFEWPCAWMGKTTSQAAGRYIIHNE